MADQDKCICGAELISGWNALRKYACGAFTTPVTILVPCPKAHEIAVERGERIERLERAWDILEESLSKREREIELLKGEIEHLQYIHGPAREASPKLMKEYDPCLNCDGEDGDDCKIFEDQCPKYNPQTTKEE